MAFGMFLSWIDLKCVRDVKISVVVSNRQKTMRRIMFNEISRSHWPKSILHYENLLYRKHPILLLPEISHYFYSYWLRPKRHQTDTSRSLSIFQAIVLPTTIIDIYNHQSVATQTNQH